MSEWKRVKIGEFLTQYRITHLVQDDKYYGQITISKNNTIKFRENNIGKSIGRKRQFVIDLKQYPHTLIFTRQGVLDGSIGIAPAEVDGCIATENMPMFSINYEVIHPELLLYLIKSEMFKQKVKTIMPTGSAQKSIHERELLELDFLLPSKIKHQQKLVNNLKRYDETILPVLNEENLNIERIKKLRQAILQEAIEGKLTADWRVKNPIEKGNPDFDAAALLATIKAEKQKLIAEGKIKKEKPLAPINPDDVPFALPDGWVWVRLGEIIKMIYGDGLTKINYKTDGKYPVYGSNGIVGYYDEYLTDKRTIIVGRKGSAGALNISNKPSWTTDVAYYIEEIKNINFYFLHYLLKFLRLEKLGKGIKPGINRNEVYDLIISLPPLAEQNVIVERVDRLLASVNALEQQVQERKTYAEQLMQAVLKEAFAG